MNKKQGFTLIELLVVVLIIGILAAVALPQYTKAVEKSRLTELLTIQKSLEQAAEVYLLANGESGGGVSIVDSLDISFPDFQKRNSWYCNARNVCFDVRISGGAFIQILRWPINDYSGAPLYEILSFRYSGSSTNAGKWDRRYSNCGMDLSKFGLESLGYSKDMDCF